MARLTAGVMSGTSLDGIDVALVRLEGSGRELRWELVHGYHHSFPDLLREQLFHAARARSVSVDAFVRLHVRLGELYAEAVSAALAAAGSPGLDAVGCHGQTVRHLPDPVDVAGCDVAATLQLGSGPVLANRLGAVAVTDFRSADLALGGQGAPLVPYVDWVLFADSDRPVAALNIGGIANITRLPSSRREQVTAFDTGPGNMVIDALAHRFFGERFDPEGQHAARGTVIEPLLEVLMRHPYFARHAPKSTGREEFGDGYVRRLLAYPDAAELSPEDLLATVTELTAATVAEAAGDARALFVAGGGVHNRTLMEALERRLPGVEVRSTAEVGVDPDLKEALAFAILAHETLQGVPTSLPAVTGATRPARLGVISQPS